MKLVIKNFSGTLVNGTCYRVQWEIDNKSITLTLKHYDSVFEKYTYQDLKCTLFTKENFYDQLVAILKDASNDWGIDLVKIKKEQRTLKTA